MGEVVMTPLDEDGKWCVNTGKPCVRWLATSGLFDGTGSTQTEAMANLNKAQTNGRTDHHHQNDAE